MSGGFSINPNDLNSAMLSMQQQQYLQQLQQLNTNSAFYGGQKQVQSEASGFLPAALAGGAIVGVGGGLGSYFFNNSLLDSQGNILKEFLPGVQDTKQIMDTAEKAAQDAVNGAVGGKFEFNAVNYKAALEKGEVVIPEKLYISQKKALKEEIIKSIRSEKDVNKRMELIKNLKEKYGIRTPKDSPKKIAEAIVKHGNGVEDVINTRCAKELEKVYNAGAEAMKKSLNSNSIVHARENLASLEGIVKKISPDAVKELSAENALSLLKEVDPTTKLTAESGLESIKNALSKVSEVKNNALNEAKTTLQNLEKTASETVNNNIGKDGKLLKEADKTIVEAFKKFKTSKALKTAGWAALIGAAVIGIGYLLFKPKKSQMVAYE